MQAEQRINMSIFRRFHDEAVETAKVWEGVAKSCRFLDCRDGKTEGKTVKDEPGLCARARIQSRNMRAKPPAPADDIYSCFRLL